MNKDVYVVGAGGCGQTCFGQFLEENNVNVVDFKNGWIKHSAKRIDGKSIFVYGDPLLTILSHFRRNKDKENWNTQATKFLGDIHNIPEESLSSLEEYFKLVDLNNSDIWGLKEQFEEWLNHEDIIFIQVDDIMTSQNYLNNFLGCKLNYDIWVDSWKGRTTKKLADNAPSHIKKIYNELYDWMKSKAIEKNKDIAFGKSFSQLGQESWILEETNFKSGGFFVEAGACDGIQGSNTFLLEKKHNWSGICCEPNEDYHTRLFENRNCHIETKCLYGKTDETVDFYNCHMIGGIGLSFREPMREEERMSSRKSKVKTISLNDLLSKYNAPKHIDYISLDTEGSELLIVDGFDFSKYEVSYWTIEHNTNDSNGSKLLEGLVKIFSDNGYQYKIVKYDVWFYK